MKKIFFFFFYFFSINLHAQDTTFARHILDTLTSMTFTGRGYTNDGVHKAMNFLEEQFHSIGLQPMDGKNFIQPLSFSVNTFPGEMSLKVDGKELRPGYDFIIGPDSKSLKGSFELEKVDSSHFTDKNHKLTISTADKLTWSVSTKVSDHTSIKILKNVLTGDPHRIELNVENKFIKKFKTGNVCGIVKGKTHPDSLIIFSAHYDHLGGMGRDIYFPGANDNASGVSLLLGLAKYYSKNPQSYSIGFICFTGEEAGLIGSEYFTNHPLIPLSKIRFLINLDLTGTGVEGITVVNATEFEREFKMLKDINENEKLLMSINPRGKAKNSDHYWFTEKGVPSFFIYTLGGIKAYHDVYDVSATLPNSDYNGLFVLLTKFVLEKLAD